ncbi:hypothetical protein VHEMI09417 [[Torrubiella] hemipterigena]|uniref:G-patch domain-containing protein n=1 Tax=[Torrubiella] hemipterigena TaxID=1531966 RepID=A0A0A1TPZ9_9HYPO|nr:hypothetical protein VHEMI09417 [[Torrubiella] hemipterigena]
MRRSRAAARLDDTHDIQDDEGHHRSDDDDIPLHHKPGFGAGLKRKRVEFVKAQEPDAGITAVSTTSSPGRSIGDIYASIVLRKSDSKEPTAKTPEALDKAESSKEPEICASCSLPITTSLQEHESTLAHQVSLKHSHPPSSLDRSRIGLRALASQGWDPDARIGLGKEGEGVRFPIKVTSKDDNLGIGAAEEIKRRQEEAAKKKQPVVQEEVKVLSAKELKVQAAKERQNAVKLQAEIFGRDDLEKYLTPRKEWE